MPPLKPSPPVASLPTDPPDAPRGLMLAIDLPDALAAQLSEGRLVRNLDPAQAIPQPIADDPDTVVAMMLFSPDLDAQDMIAMLVAQGYRGSLLVIAPPLPNPQMVQRELAKEARGLEVRLVTR